MHKRHFPAIAAIDITPALAYRVRQYFDLGSKPLIYEMSHFSQADLVLCLIRIGTPRARQITESLIGRPITVGPACKLHWSFNKQMPSLRRQPVITWVKDAYLVPLRRGTRLALCYPEFKCGRTLQQLRQRGVSRGDISRAVNRGWIKLAGA
jgi:hypothetical protein